MNSLPKMYQCGECSTMHTGHQWNYATHIHLGGKVGATEFSNMGVIEKARFGGSSFYHCPSCEERVWDNHITPVLLPVVNRQAVTLLRKEVTRGG